MGKQKFGRAKRNSLYEALKEYVALRFPELLGYYCQSPRRMARVDKLFHLINARAGALEILDDKFLLNSLVVGAGYEAPQILGITSTAGFFCVKSCKSMSLASGFSSLEGDIFIKARRGSKGRRALSLSARQDGFFVSGNVLSCGDLVQLVRSFEPSGSVIQRAIKQHPRFASFHAKSVNTLRILTISSPATPRVAAATLRMGCHGSVVDNASAGGIYVGVDLKTKQLYANGWNKQGHSFTEHPTTGITFEGCTLPYFGEARRACLNLHALLDNYVYTVGWDVAVGENGPIVVEGNWAWDCALHSRSDPDFVYRMCARLLNDSSWAHIQTPYSSQTG